MKKESPNKIFYKTSYAEEQFNIIDIRRKTRTKRGETTLIPAYNEPPAIPNNKKNDLLSLCQANLIPKKYKQFFQSLKGTNMKPEDHDSE